eukprot:COSAG01_NODE_40375_length_464_cov_1.531507_2_plen_90_part_01
MSRLCTGLPVPPIMMPPDFSRPGSGASLRRRIDLSGDQKVDPCKSGDQNQPACTFGDQQDTIFLAHDARPRPVVQSHNPESDRHYTSVLF